MNDPYKITRTKLELDKVFELIFQTNDFSKEYINELKKVIKHEEQFIKRQGADILKTQIDPTTILKTYIDIYLKIRLPVGFECVEIGQTPKFREEPNKGRMLEFYRVLAVPIIFNSMLEIGQNNKETPINKKILWKEKATELFTLFKDLQDESFIQCEKQTIAQMISLFFIDKEGKPFNYDNVKAYLSKKDKSRRRFGWKDFN